MLIASYWSARKDSKAQISSALASFLASLSTRHPKTFTWFRKGRSRASALRGSVNLTTPSGVRAQLSQNRRDSDGSAIADLGWSISVWNGRDVQFSANMGVHSPRLLNSVILKFGGWAPSETEQREILTEMIESFDPDHAVVTSDDVLDKAGARKPWEAGWWVYERGGRLRSVRP